MLSGAVVLVLSVSLVTGCQTVSKTDFLAAKYSTAVNCIRAHVDQRLTTKTKTESEIGDLVRAGTNACEVPMKSYIQAIIQDLKDKKNWTWLGPESHTAITEEIVITTSLMLQHEYNGKALKS